MKKEQENHKHLPCRCGHYVAPISSKWEWWWCSACGCMATVEDGEITTWWVPNHDLEGVSWEDEREEEKRILEGTG